MHLAIPLVHSYFKDQCLVSIKILALPYLYSVYRKFQTSKFSIRNIPPQKISQKNCSHDILVWAERIYHEKKLFWIKIFGEENLWLNFLGWSCSAQKPLMIQVSNMSMHSGRASVQMPIITKLIYTILHASHPVTTKLTYAIFLYPNHWITKGKSLGVYHHSC